MEQSKLISSAIARLKIAYPYYFKELKTEELVGLINMYQEELCIYNETTLINAIKSIIRKNKFMPTLKEILDECELCKTSQKNIVIEKMIKAGYFKDSKEIDKTYKFMEKGIIPNWLLEDMKKYGYEDSHDFISTNSTKMLNAGGGNNDN